MAVGSPLGGPLAERLGPLPPLVAGGAMIAVALFVLAGVDLSTTYADLWRPILILGVGDRPVADADEPRGDELDPDAACRGRRAASSRRCRGLGHRVRGRDLRRRLQRSSSRRPVAIAGQKGVRLSDAQAEDLDGLLAGASDAMAALAKYGAGAQKVIADAVHEAFVLGLGGALLVGAAVALVGLVAAMALIRRETPADEREQAASAA